MAEALGQTEVDDTQAIAADIAATTPQTGEKRESSDEEDSDTCPATPVAGRRKRHRQWRWTLGPVEASSDMECLEDQHREDSGVGEDEEEGL